MHITIAGNLGSGKSTVCGVLESKYGFSIYSTGKIQRSIAEKLNLTTLEMNYLMNNDLSYDHMIDDEVARISSEQVDKTIVFDSRMSWHFAKNSFKVFLIIDPLEAARRIINTRTSSVENYSSIEDAVANLAERAKVENERFKRIYNVDNLKYKNYDLIVDTTFMPPEQIADIIYENFKKHVDTPFEDTLIITSPKSVYPTHSMSEINQDTVKQHSLENDFNNPIIIKNFDGYNYIINGHHRLLSALLNKNAFICAKMIDDTDKNIVANTDDLTNKLNSVGISTLYDLESLGEFSYSSYPKYYK